MTIIIIRNLQKSFGDQLILKDITFDIKQGDRIGLVGRNGAGKSTLADLIFGRQSPDTGIIESMQRNIKIGYLLQSTEYTANDFQTMMQDQTDQGFLAITGRLGLKKLNKWEGERSHHLSGGEKLKLSIAKVWSTKPDLLILDEPTNHLDFQGVQWLINELKSFYGAVMIISHDRYFLDQTVNRMLEIEEGKLNTYSGNYSEYREEKQRRFESQLHQYTVQQRRIKEIQSQIDTLKNWAKKAHNQAGKKGTSSERRQIDLREFERVKAKKLDKQVKSKMRRLEKELEQNKWEKPKQETKAAFQFQASGKRGHRIIEANNVAKSFGNRLLFQHSHFYIKYGERIGFLVKTGAGKRRFFECY
jgi:macrolide transport system ATP-binding/permease protein